MVLMQLAGTVRDSTCFNCAGVLKVQLIIPELSVKSKVLPYSLTIVGHGADPGVQAVSPQVTF